jgi:hypothetical protein
MHDYPPLRPTQLVPRCADMETPLLESTSTSQALKGFKSKSGRAFDARLKLDQGEVRFDFES